ncbi:MAG: class I SAM-dependent methyltransferase [Anaerolineaceae bacterium]|nr:class I SAM-dependent methyltransferase [Anaerolineaceae bacterium]
MEFKDEIAASNQIHWERMAAEGCGYTIPWLDLDISLFQRYLEGEIQTLPEPYEGLYPVSIFADVQEKEVLCLASGGGQQSAVFGLLGAHVTVVDLAEGQLNGDRKAAAHYGYDVKTVQADMRNLSALEDNSFDLIYQANSIGYVPDVRPVFNEAARVLRKTGLYRPDFGNPAIAFMEWDGQHYSISKPYAETFNRRDEAIDHRHYMDDIFNGLLDAGFIIRRVNEAPYYQQPDENALPGSWPHEQSYVAGEFAVIAEKL